MPKPEALQHTIVVDTREQLPYEFDGYPTVRKKLDAGDYSLLGCEHRVAIERKSKADAWGMVTDGPVRNPHGNRQRFIRCLDRLAALERSAIVIECSVAEFMVQPDRTKVSAAVAIGSYISWWAHYGVGVFFAGNRRVAERFVVKYLASFARHCYDASASPVSPAKGD